MDAAVGPGIRVKGAGEGDERSSGAGTGHPVEGVLAHDGVRGDGITVKGGASRVLHAASILPVATAAEDGDDRQQHSRQEGDQRHGDQGCVTVAAAAAG